MARKLLFFVILLTSLTACAAENNDVQGLPWWGWLLIILIIALIVWLLLRKSPEKPETTKLHTEEVLEAEMEETAATPQVMAVNKDDLKVIEGIGPKIESVLNAAGIQSYSQVAQMDAAKIREILSAGGIRFAFPESWPEQANLAAEGDMEKLRILQEQLNAGRKE